MATETITSTTTAPAVEARTRCEIWTRVMGYHRPVSQFNTGKKSEHYSRKHFTAYSAANSSFCDKYAPTEVCA